MRLAGGCATVCVGGEGLFNMVLQGPGLVILESMSIRKVRKLFSAGEKKKKSKVRSGAEGPSTPSSPPLQLGPWLFKQGPSLTLGTGHCGQGGVAAQVVGGILGGS